MPALVTRQAPASPELASRLVKQAAERMLSELRIQTAELSVLLTDDETIRALNYEHRKKDQATDVLSFPMMDPDDEQLDTLDGGPLGDVVISLDTAQRQAIRHRRELLHEVRQLLAHGLLHLLGYDHETDVEEHEMNAMTERLLAATKLPTGE